MNRREVMIGIGLAGAVVAAPMGTARVAKAASRGQWDAALARYRAAEEAYDAAWSIMEEAEEAVHAAVPRVDRFFDDYRLGRGMKRDDVEFWLRQYVTRTGRRIDVQAEADAFEANDRAHRQAQARFGSKVLEAEAKALAPAFFQARDALMEIPAPDTEALLVKLQVAAQSLNDEHAASALADSQRLLAREA